VETLMVEMFEAAAASGQLEQQDITMDDTAFVQLLDSMAEGYPDPQPGSWTSAPGWAGTQQPSPRQAPRACRQAQPVGKRRPHRSPARGQL